VSKSISSALLAHKSSSSSTLCFLLLIGPLPDASYLGLTSLDIDVTYNPHDYDSSQPNVTQKFYAHTGTQLSTLASANDLSVDNGEAQTLIYEYPSQGITQEMIDSGKLNGVAFVIYQVNYKDLSPTMGHEIMGSGPIGEVKQQRGGLITFECRSWSQYLKQNSVCELDSLTCRVKKFGSQPGEERYPCNKDISSLWVHSQVVTNVGGETVREFTASALAQGDDYFAPGLVLWLTGDNADQDQEVETFASGGIIALQFITRYPIQIGDTFDIRPDCTREKDGNNGCIFHDNFQWFRGEPLIPVADTIALTIPGAAA